MSINARYNGDIIESSLEKLKMNSKRETADERRKLETILDLKVEGDYQIV